MKQLTARRISVRYGHTVLLDQVDLEVAAGDWYMIIGPNGAGKSTLLNVLAQWAPYRGTVECDGVDLARLRPALRAQRIGLLSQSHRLDYAFSVAEVVRLGRYAHRRGRFQWAGSQAEPETDLCDQAVALTGLTDLLDHSVLTLSGGELQRVFLAQALAQDPDILLLDEPTNHLDLIHQQQIFQVLRSWVAQPGKAIVSVIHDLSLARAYGSHAVLLDRGQTVASGHLNEVVQPELINRVYGLDVRAWLRKMLAQWDEPTE
ncbi:MAG: ABC transporter ATP-binding protein [Propionibacteriaceae bacterium]|jgi:iron complex transport system ATP-binding protein|nr:ABC transporter ATP-binding protein [Propionibacteriaceae bacterium]